MAEDAGGAASYNQKREVFVLVKRNTLVLALVTVILAVFAWAGWVNWQYRRQAAEEQAELANEHAKLFSSEGTGEGTGSSTLQSNNSLVGKPAPNFTLEDLNGKEVSLSSYRGKAVLINFWATWCTPCQIETPWLVALSRKYGPQGFEVLGVSSEGDGATPKDTREWSKDKEAIEQFVHQEKVPYPVLLGGDRLSTPYGGVDYLPTSFYVNRKGIIVAVETGLTPKSEMVANIRKALGK